jgi:hypothetical protein
MAGDEIERFRREILTATTLAEVPVIVPTEDEESEVQPTLQETTVPPEARQSYQVQSSLAKLGIAMGFKIWTPRNDRVRAMELPTEKESVLHSSTVCHSITTTQHRIRLNKLTCYG